MIAHMHLVKIRNTEHIRDVTMQISIRTATSLTESGVDEPNWHTKYLLIAMQPVNRSQRQRITQRIRHNIRVHHMTLRKKILNPPQIMRHQRENVRVDLINTQQSTREITVRGVVIRRRIRPINIPRLHLLRMNVRHDVNVK